MRFASKPAGHSASRKAALRLLARMKTLKPERPGMHRVRTRIVVFFTVLLVLVQGAAFLLVNAANSDNARSIVDQELATGERIVRRGLEHESDRLAKGALAYDEAFVREVARLTELQVSFAVREPGGAWSIAASTLPAGSRATLAARLPEASVLRDGRAQVSLEGRDYQIRTLNVSPGQGTEIMAVLQRSPNDTLARTAELQTLLMGLAAVSLGGSLIGSVFIARGITGPLNRLARAAARISRGDYSQPIDIASGDEIGAVAQAFNRMREGIESHEKEILRLAYEDRLTGLPNRALFNDRLAGAVNLARRNGTPLAVMLMDLDRFKHINDTLGHTIGDNVLREVATRLRAALRESDTIARLGGDEFGVLLPTAHEDQIGEVVHKILRAIEQPIEADGQWLDVGASIGIARFPEHGDKPDTLISRADVAMYLAKAANSEFAFYDATHDGTQQEQLSLLGELRRAMERQELRVYFQPKIDLRTGRTRGVEALVRWMHPMRGIVPPIEFMPFAERTGFVRTVTRFVLETALTRCGQWLAQGMRLQVSINISVRDLQNTDLPDIVASLLASCTVPPELVCLEITESSFMENPQRALHTLGRLRALGIRLSIDDFGTGFSSLAYLRKLRVHEIKIDRTFIAAMEESDDMVIVRSTIELAHNLGLNVVAEGIEDEKSLARLRAMDCDEAQGFLMSRPLPEDRLLEWLHTSPHGLRGGDVRALPLLRYA
jgi:diguanylate cyclase (GGDEF)-like protein